MNNNFPQYPAYKPSGAEWLGEVPEHWGILANKYIFRLKKNRVGKKSGDYVLLSLTLNGVIKRDMENPQGKFPAEFDTYQEVSKGDFIFCLFDVEETPRTVGLSDYDGMITGAYTVMQPNDNFDKGFLYYFYLNLDADKRLKPLYTGLRNTISKENFFSFKTFVPPLEEQATIAQFLDRKTALIDQAIGIKEKQIELLKERRQILIHKAVTRGLNPDVKMKESGVERIGEVPEHWEVRRAKYLFDEINIRSKNGDEELLSVSHMTGVTPRSEKNISMFQAEDYSNSKLCQKDDLIFNIMWAWMGALGVSDREGIVSPSYAVYRQKERTFNSWYIEKLLGSPNYVTHYNRVSTGLHSSRLRFYSNMFFEMAVGYPPIEEQDEIVEYLMLATKKNAKAISLKEKEIEKLKEYKATLINSAVTGKVRVISDELMKVDC
jgi:type I restriction enzyme S subunit